MDLLLVAWRYLVARPITYLSTFAVTVGLAAIVLVDAVMSGFLGEQRAMIRALLPDVTVAVDSLDPAAVDALAGRLRAEPGVLRVDPRAETAALHKREGGVFAGGVPRVGDNYFVQLIGLEAGELAGPLRHVLDPAVIPAGASLAAIDASFLAAANVARPEDPFWFDPADPYWASRLPESQRRNDSLTPILFGRRLAQLFQYRPGTVVTLATFGGALEAGRKLPPRTRPFVVVGTYSSLHQNHDDTHAIVPRAALVDFAALPVAVHELALRVEGEPAAMRDRLRAGLADLGVPERAIETWEDRRHLLLDAVESERRVMNVAMFFVVIVATFALFATLHQLVRRKTRDVGVLAALGAPAGHAGRLFLLCGLMVTLAGSLLGLAGGIALAHWLNPLLAVVERLTGFRLFDRHLFRFEFLPIVVEGSRVASYALATVACGTLFTLLPAWRAARLDPVEALRDE